MSNTRNNSDETSAANTQAAFNTVYDYSVFLKAHSTKANPTFKYNVSLILCRDEKSAKKIGDYIRNNFKSPKISRSDLVMRIHDEDVNCIFAAQIAIDFLSINATDINSAEWRFLLQPPRPLPEKLKDKIIEIKKEQPYTRFISNPQKISDACQDNDAELSKIQEKIINHQNLERGQAAVVATNAAITENRIDNLNVNNNNRPMSDENNFLFNAELINYTSHPYYRQTFTANLAQISQVNRERNEYNHSIIYDLTSALIKTGINAGDKNKMSIIVCNNDDEARALTLELENFIELNLGKKNNFVTSIRANNNDCIVIPQSILDLFAKATDKPSLTRTPLELPKRLEQAIIGNILYNDQLKVSLENTISKQSTPVKRKITGGSVKKSPKKQKSQPMIGGGHDFTSTTTSTTTTSMTSSLNETYSNKNEIDDEKIMVPAAKEEEQQIKYFYNPKSKADMRELEKLCNFTYDTEYNDISKLDLEIKKVHVTNDYGLFTLKPIKYTQGALFKYAGKARNTPGNGPYSVNLPNGSSIDAQSIGDISRFVNHSDTPNMHVDLSATFHPLRDIQPGEQLTFDYGHEYFEFLRLNRYYLYHTDDHRSPYEIYSANKKYYHDALVIFDQKIVDDFGLSKKTWLVPKSFKAIMENNHELLQNTAMPLDLLAYACDEDTKISETKHQQHITPFMFACYMGSEKCITALLKRNVDVNRCTLVEGLPAIVLLMKGNASKELKEKIGIKILEKMDFPFIANRENLTILHYAIENDLKNLVSQYLRMGNEDRREDLFSEALRHDRTPKHADLDYCILHGRFEMLKLLLNKIIEYPKLLPKGLMKNIEDGLIFRKETLENASLENLRQFEQLISKTKYSEHIPDIFRYKLLSEIATKEKHFMPSNKKMM